MDPERRREIEEACARVSSPEEYEEMKAAMKAAMDQFAESFSGLIKGFAETYRADVFDLLIVIDRQAAEIKRLELALEVRRCRALGEIG